MSRFAYSCAAVGLIAGISATALPAGAQTPTYCEPDVGSPANLKTIKLLKKQSKNLLKKLLKKRPKKQVKMKKQKKQRKQKHQRLNSVKTSC